MSSKVIKGSVTIDGQKLSVNYNSITGNLRVGLIILSEKGLKHKEQIVRYIEKEVLGNLESYDLSPKELI